MAAVQGQRGTAARLTTETKQAFKTTEFAVMVLAVIGILIAAVVGGNVGRHNNVHDSFPAIRAWLYITIVVAAYMVSRGLAKCGSREAYWADEHDLPGERKDRI